MHRIIRHETAMVEVFARYVVKNGKIIYPKRSKYFHFWVKGK